MLTLWVDSSSSSSSIVFLSVSFLQMIGVDFSTTILPAVGDKEFKEEEEGNGH
jgi:hypothetical protein